MRNFKAKKTDTLLNILMETMGFKSFSKGKKLIKSGQVKVDGVEVKIPSAEIKEGSSIRILERAVKASTGKACPYPIIFENEHMLAFEKPTGIMTASPDKKKRTAFTLVKNWMLEEGKGIQEAYFVNKLPRDASGIVLVAKNAPTFKVLRDGWNKFEKRYYALAEGFFDEDGVIGKRMRKSKVGEEEIVFPYRLMSQGERYALLRVDMQKEQFSEFFSVMEQKGTSVPGYARRGKANNPIGRLGFHFFSIEVPVGLNKTELIKTRVPRDFLKLVKHNQV